MGTQSDFPRPKLAPKFGRTSRRHCVGSLENVASMRVSSTFAMGGGGGVRSD